MTALLSIFEVDQPVRQVVLEPGRAYSVGREPSCEICIDDPEISRRHASLEFQGSRWTITDNLSKNGIAVAGRTLTEAVLRDNTWIGIGSLAIRFEELSADQLKRQTLIQEKSRHQTMDGRRLMSAAADISSVLENLLGSTLSLTDADRAFVMLTQEDGDLKVACQSTGRQSLEPQVFIGSASAVKSALESRAPVVVCDATVHQQLSSKASVISSQIRALVCLPMVLFGRVLGVIYADSQQPGKLFTELDIKLLGELAEHAALIVAAAQLDDQLEGVGSEAGDQLEYANQLRERVATIQHRIPDIGRRTSQLRTQPATGVRWSWIESQL